MICMSELKPSHGSVGHSTKLSCIFKPLFPTLIVGAYKTYTEI